MHLQESGEMYLETILILTNKNNVVRSIDIAEEMDYSKPSVSRAINLLKSNGYISVDKDGYIKLTKSGLNIASKIYERHQYITDFLVSLGVSPKNAAIDACKMEHDISDESFAAMKKHIKKK